MKMHILWINRRKLINLLLCLGILLTLIFISKPPNVSSKIYYYLYPEVGIGCYNIKRDSLPEISSISPKKGSSIFFHETSCNSFMKEKITISPRQACAVESAARMNPGMDVYLLFTSPGKFNFQGDESDKMLQALLKYKNVKIMHLDFEKYVKGTPLEELYKSGLIQNSDYARSHASDVLRYLTLWKYGGIYLDLDVIVIKSLEDLKSNYAGAESEEHVAAGVLSFSPDGLGHQLAESCLDDLRKHFNGHDWGYNGPGVITRLLKNICKAELAKEMIENGCDGFTVYPENYFYPVPWWDWEMYFNANETKTVFDMTKASYAIHVWNKHSTNTKIPKTARVPYLMFAEKYCPRVLKKCHNEF